MVGTWVLIDPKEVILDLLTPQSNDINGKFLWIKDGIKKPIQSWD
jgi:hypothetical protein